MSHRKLFVLSAPSGVGKDTVVRALIEHNPSIQVAISHTSRAPREGDRDDVDYYFLDRPAFEKMIVEDAFIEWAEYVGNLYGTSKQEIERLQSIGNPTLLVIEVQGGEAIKKLFPESQRIFLIPPSEKVLKERLQGRGTDDEKTIAKRLEHAHEEMKYAPEYDYQIVNNELEDTVQQVLAIIQT